MPRGKGKVPSSLERGSLVKKILVSSVMAGTLALLLSSCFVLQSFSILATSLHRGDKTKAQFVLHPFQEAATFQGENIRNRYQFIIVGVPDTGDLTVGSAKWGTNGKFGGPSQHPRSGALSGATPPLSAPRARRTASTSKTSPTWSGKAL